MSDHLLLNNVINLLVDIRSHLQKKPEMLVVINKIDQSIREMEEKLKKEKFDNAEKSYLLNLIAKILDRFPSIIELINKITG